jgi:hypothetical protein
MEGKRRTSVSCSGTARVQWLLKALLQGSRVEIGNHPGSLPVEMADVNDVGE